MPLTEQIADLWKPLIDIVNDCSSRWRTFSLDALDFVLPHLVGDSKGVCILECLRVGSSCYNSQQSSYQFSLRDVTLIPIEVVSFATPLRSIDDNWSNLTTAEIENLHVYECLVLLQKAQRLTTGEFNQLRTGRDKHLLPPGSIIHDALRCLSLFSDDSEAPRQLLDNLTLPSLVDLTYDTSSNSPKSVSAFLQRSASAWRLTALSILHWGGSHNLLTVASHLQAVKRLEYYRDFYDCLQLLNGPITTIEGKDVPDLLPNLHEVSIFHEVLPWRLLADLFLFHPLSILSVHLTKVKRNCGWTMSPPVVSKVS